MTKYITKNDCIKKGFIKTGKGIYKMSLLEKYFKNGWLEFGSDRYSSDDRFSAALKLQRDYEMSCFAGSSSAALKQKIDGSSGLGIEDIDSIRRARDRYFGAIKQIPEEFWGIVKRICIDGLEPKIPEGLANRRRLEFCFSLKRDLSRGLDRLVRYYAFK